MAQLSLSDYLKQLREHHTQTFYRERHFQAAEEWIKFSGSGHRGWNLSEYDPGLAGLLNNRSIVILGEPGSGKSTSASAAVLHAIDRGWVPIFAPLRGYRGQLNEELYGALPDEAAPEQSTRLYVLDGFDEIPGDQIETLVAEIESLEKHDSNARFVLTSRQAFFVSKETSFSRRWPTFYIDDLTSDDVDAFIATAGQDRALFRAEIARAELYSESRNPFVLGALLKAFELSGRLPDTRSEAVRYLIDSTLASRAASEPAKQRRALRMLAVAMEAQAKNELSVEHAVQVLVRSIDRMTEGRATELLDTLGQSILLRTPRGFSFQMRSYGEYLAAEELADVQEPHRPLSLMFLEGQRVLGASWSNCITFLAELHGGFRRLMSRQFPEAVVTSSPIVFSESERSDIVRGLVVSLAANTEYLNYHPVLRADRLARFVTADNLAMLRAELVSTDSVRVANAAILLAATGDRSSADAIFNLAIDETRPWPLRQSALAFLSEIGHASMVPHLLAAVMPEGNASTTLSPAVALMDRSQFAMVLSALATSDSIISAAWERFDEMNDAADVAEAITALLTIDVADIRNNLVGTLAGLWRALVRLWRPEFAPIVATLLCRWGGRGHHESSSDDLVKELLHLPDQGEAVGERLAAEIVADPELLGRLDLKAYHLVGIATADRVVADGHTNLTGYLRAFGRQDVRTHLIPPFDENYVEDPALAEARKEHENWEAQQARWIAQAQVAELGNDVLVALSHLDKKQWPDLTSQQVERVGKTIDLQLTEGDLRQRIVWKGPHTWEAPGVLGLLLAALDRYSYRLTDDRPLVWALMGLNSGQVLRYFHRHGLSAPAWAEARRLLTDDTLHDQALLGVLVFWRDSETHDAEAVRHAATIAVGRRPLEIRGVALDVILKNSSDPAIIAPIAAALSADLKSRGELALLEIGHRATTERKLTELLDDAGQLASGNIESRFDNPLQWVGKITNVNAWPKLVALRKLALQFGFGPVVDIITGTMSRIDLLKLAQVVDEQVLFAPADWQPIQRVRAREYHRDGTIKAAQDAPFDKVLRRMRQTTTIKRFKIWTEGSHETKAIETLVALLPENVADDIVVDALGGWGTVLGANWNAERLWDGCHDLLVLLDGDGGRDFALAGYPIKTAGRVPAALAKMAAAGVDRVILQRWAFENYFPESAFTAVVGVGAATAFPLSHIAAVENQMSGYRKEMNAQLAACTTLADFGGTDLGDFFQAVFARAK